MATRFGQVGCAGSPRNLPPKTGHHSAVTRQEDTSMTRDVMLRADRSCLNYLFARIVSNTTITIARRHLGSAYISLRLTVGKIPSLSLLPGRLHWRHDLDDHFRRLLLVRSLWAFMCRAWGTQTDAEVFSSNPCLLSRAAVYAPRIPETRDLRPKTSEDRLMPYGMVNKS